MDRTVHLAAQFVVVRGRLIQRCAVCGYKLVDTKNYEAPIPEDGSTFVVGHCWLPNQMVEVSPGRQLAFEDPPDGKIPDHFCIDLVED